MTILSICENPDVLQVVKVVRTVIDIIKIAVPIILIISLMLSFTQVILQKDEALSKEIHSSVRKIVAALLIFLVPTFVDLIFDVLDKDKSIYVTCYTNATEENIKIAYIKQAQEYVNIANESLNRGDYNLAYAKIQKLEDEDAKARLTTEIKKIEQDVIKKEETAKSAIQTISNPVSSFGFIWPLDKSNSSTITTCFRSNDPLHRDLGSKHEAIDIAAENNTPVLASKDGIVTYPYEGSNINCPQTSYIPMVNGKYNCSSVGCTNYIVIKHDDGSETEYLHLYAGTIKVKAGDRVKQGQVIAGVGSSGCSTGPHLHFVIKIDGVPVDPLEVVGNQADSCASDCACCK